MNRRLLTTIVILSALIFVPVLACADDLADLTDASHKILAAMNAKDANTVCSMIHDNYIVYGASAIFATDGKNPNCAATLTANFAMYDAAQSTSVNPTFRVIGNVGIVYGHLLNSYKLKDGAPEGYTSRFINVWIKEKGKWLMIVNSSARLNLGR